MEARVLLPLGEGGPKGRMRCISCPHPALRATLSQRERDMAETGFQIENPMKPASILLLERTASRNLDKSAPKGRGTFREQVSQIEDSLKQFVIWTDLPLQQAARVSFCLEENAG